MDFIVVDGVLESYVGTDEDIVIPEEVQRIGDVAFARNKTIVNVIIPENVMYVGEDAFDSCPNLRRVEMRNPDMRIGSMAFSACEKLSEVILPAALKDIPLCLFGECESLTTIKIPDTVKSIDDAAFECTGITEIVLPDGLEFIGKHVFSGCKSLQSVPKLPEGLKYKEGSFLDCPLLFGENGLNIVDGIFFGVGPSVTEVIIPEGVEKIDASACRNNKKITKLVIPSSVERIGELAFNGCENLVSLEIKSDSTDLGTSAFGGCKGLARDNFIIIKGVLSGYIGNSKSVRIPDGVEIIGENCFRNKKIQEIIIPSGVKRVARRAISLESLSRLVVEGADVTFAPASLPPMNNFTEIISESHISMFAFGFSFIMRNPKNYYLLHTNNIDNFDEDHRMLMLYGFLNNPECFSGDEFEMYKEFAKEKANLLMERVLDDDRVFMFFVENKLITADEIDSWIETATIKEEVEKTAVLLQYKMDLK